jgi:uncharacterized protein YkwD
MVLATSFGMSIVFPGCAAVGFWTPQNPPPTDPQWPAPDPPEKLDVEEVRADLLALHNKSRSAEKLPKVAVSLKLQKAAQGHAEEMAGRRKMTHTGADGSTVLERVQGQGYRLKRCGENIAYGHYTPEHVMRGWLDSRPHRKNILGSFTQIGVGYATAKNGTPYWCVNFGLPAR